jgi:hypothetical protein
LILPGFALAGEGSTCARLSGDKRPCRGRVASWLALTMAIAQLLRKLSRIDRPSCYSRVSPDDTGYDTARKLWNGRLRALVAGAKSCTLVNVFMICPCGVAVIQGQNLLVVG